MSFDKLTERIIVKGQVILDTPLHIGSGKKDIDIGDVDNPIITDIYDQAYIPGSTLKGKVRSEAERIARSKYPNICYPPNVKNMCGSKEYSFDKMCICCSIFGTAGASGGTSIASKIKFRDGYPIDKIEAMLTRSGTTLDRKTGSTSSGSLYTTEAVPAGVRFNFEFVCDNMTEEEMRLLKAALKSVEDSSLGGLSSRGFGKVRFEIKKLIKRDPKYYLGEDKTEKILSDMELQNWLKI